MDRLGSILGILQGLNGSSALILDLVSSFISFEVILVGFLKLCLGFLYGICCIIKMGGSSFISDLALLILGIFRYFFCSLSQIIDRTVGNGSYGLLVL